jgi:hypothetical protein
MTKIHAIGILMSGKEELYFLLQDRIDKFIKDQRRKGVAEAGVFGHSPVSAAKELAEALRRLYGKIDSGYSDLILLIGSSEFVEMDRGIKFQLALAVIEFFEKRDELKERSSQIVYEASQIGVLKRAIGVEDAASEMLDSAIAVARRAQSTCIELVPMRRASMDSTAVSTAAVARNASLGSSVSCTFSNPSPRSLLPSP